MKNKKQTILIILISVLIILGITAFVLATTINKTKANTEIGTEEGTSTGGGHKDGCENIGYPIPCGESCPICGKQSSSNAHKGGTHSNGGRCTICGTRYQTHRQSTTVKDYRRTPATHTPIYSCIFPDCTGTYEGEAEAHTYVGNICSVCRVTKETTGCTHSYEQKSNETEHWEYCTECGVEKTGSRGSHTGGSHSNEGWCTICGTRYQTHNKSTTIKNYRRTPATHTPMYTCTFSDCTGTLDGEAEVHSFSGTICTVCGYVRGIGTDTGGHKTGCESIANAIPCGESCPTCGAQSSSNAHEGGTHSNGGRCTICGTKYQTHRQSKTVKDYNITSTTHTPIYSCIFPDCTGTYEGEAEAHTYVGNICSVCGATKETTGCTHSYEQKSNETEHWEECTKCGEEKTGSRGSHTGGEIHNSGGRCDTCGYEYITHEQSTNFLGYESGDNGHYKTFACLAPNCNTVYRGKTESHTGGTHSNGGKCTVCNYIYQAHGQSTTVAGYDSTQTTHTPKYKCTYSGCTETILGTAEAHIITSYTSNGDQTHSGTCTKCQYKLTEACTYDGNTCTKCGATKPNTGCVHNYVLQYNATEHWKECTKCGAELEGSKKNHIYGKILPNGNGTHSKKCTGCPYSKIENCTYVNGKCSECGANKPDTECSHTYKQRYNGVQHYEECTKCGAEKPGSRQNHTYGAATSNGKGTHSKKCTGCPYIRTEYCSYVNGKCSECGGEKPDTECTHNYVPKHNETEHWEECTICRIELEGSRQNHIYGKETSNGNGTHTKKCTVCSYSKTENCNYVNGKCSECGATKPDNENPGDGQDNTNNGQNNGNNTNNGNSNNGNSNNGNSGGKPLPQTGTSSIVIIGIIAFTVLGALTFIRIKKYKLN